MTAQETAEGKPRQKLAERWRTMTIVVVSNSNRMRKWFSEVKVSICQHSSNNTLLMVMTSQLVGKDKTDIWT